MALASLPSKPMSGDWRTLRLSSGASEATAREQDRLPYSGVRASHTLAYNDLKALRTLRPALEAAAAAYDVPAEVLMAIASRESRAGRMLNKDGQWLRNDVWGIMQVGGQNNNWLGQCSGLLK